MVFVARDYIFSIPTDLETDEDARRFFGFLRIRAPLEVLLVAVKLTEVHRTNYNTPEHHQATKKVIRRAASRKRKAAEVRPAL
jgi:hypothetical protein